MTHFKSCTLLETTFARILNNLNENWFTQFMNHEYFSYVTQEFTLNRSVSISSIRKSYLQLLYVKSCENYPRNKSSRNNWIQPFGKRVIWVDKLNIVTVLFTNVTSFQKLVYNIPLSIFRKPHCFSYWRKNIPNATNQVKTRNVESFIILYNYSWTNSLHCFSFLSLYCLPKTK